MIVHKYKFRTALDQYGFRATVAGYAAMIVLGTASAISYSTHHTNAGELFGRIACVIFLASMALTYLILQGKPQETTIAVDADDAAPVDGNIQIGVHYDGSPINRPVATDRSLYDRKPSPGRHRAPSGKTINKQFLVNSFPVGGPED